jgi:hypothetical protein
MCSASGAAVLLSLVVRRQRLEGLMSHHIRGFIARADDLRRAAADFAGAQVVPLSLGFGFLPITEQLAGDDEPAPFEYMERLTTRLGAWAEAASVAFPLAYAETDYFGGHGWQAAVAWVGGNVVFGPVRTSDLYVDGKYTPTPLLEGAINRAVRLVGVDRGSVRDEFDAIGLGRHRSNESWLSVAAG